MKLTSTKAAAEKLVDMLLSASDMEDSARTALVDQLGRLKKGDNGKELFETSDGEGDGGDDVVKRSLQDRLADYYLTTALFRGLGAARHFAPLVNASVQQSFARRWTLLFGGDGDALR